MRLFLGVFLLGLALTPGRAETPPQPVAFRVGPLLFDRPQEWKWVKPEGSFRVAQLEKPSPTKTPIVMAFSRFPAGTGGTMQANVDRWIRQFSQTSSPPEVQTVSTKSYPLTLVKIRGTLKGGIPGGPEKEISNAVLQGAILEVDGEMIVVKMAGPAPLLVGEEKVFLDLVSAAAEKKP